MIQPVRLSRWFLRSSMALVATLSPFFAEAELLPADEVVIHDRGKDIVLRGSDATEVESMCTDLLRRSRWGEDALSTDEIRFIRAKEVSVEIHYAAPREFELGWTKEPARGQHLLVPLTGDSTGMDGNGAEVFVGRTAPPNEPRYLGIPYHNPPDANGVQYGDGQDAPGQLQKLRDKVVQLGVDAPRPTPRPQPSPDLTPMGEETKE